MAALPKRKHSTRRKGKRRAAIKLKLPTLVPCPSCGELKVSHQICPKCDTYKSQSDSRASHVNGKKPSLRGGPYKK